MGEYCGGAFLVEPSRKAILEDYSIVCWDPQIREPGMFESHVGLCEDLFVLLLLEIPIIGVSPSESVKLP